MEYFYKLRLILKQISGTNKYNLNILEIFELKLLCLYYRLYCKLEYFTVNLNFLCTVGTKIQRAFLQ